MKMTWMEMENVDGEMCLIEKGFEWFISKYGNNNNNKHLFASWITRKVCLME